MVAIVATSLFRYFWHFANHYYYFTIKFNAWWGEQKTVEMHSFAFIENDFIATLARAHTKTEEWLNRNEFCSFIFSFVFFFGCQTNLKIHSENTYTCTLGTGRVEFCIKCCEHNMLFNMTLDRMDNIVIDDCAIHWLSTQSRIQMNRCRYELLGRKIVLAAMWEPVLSPLLVLNFLHAICADQTKKETNNLDMSINYSLFNYMLLICQAIRFQICGPLNNNNSPNCSDR